MKTKKIPYQNFFTDVLRTYIPRADADYPIGESAVCTHMGRTHLCGKMIKTYSLVKFLSLLALARTSDERKYEFLTIFSLS